MPTGRRTTCQPAPDVVNNRTEKHHAQRQVWVMTTGRFCPISVCGRWAKEVAAERSAADLPQRVPGLALAQESHYPCHSRADWAAEAERRGLVGVVENARDFFAAVDGAVRMPSRAEIESTLVTSASPQLEGIAL